MAIILINLLVSGASMLYSILLAKDFSRVFSFSLETNANSSIYEDEDGKATTDSRAHITATHKAAIVLSPIIGVALAVMAIIYIPIISADENLNKFFTIHETYFQLATWCFIACQTIVLYRELHPVRCFWMGILIAISSMSTVIFSIVKGHGLLELHHEEAHNSTSTVFIRSLGTLGRVCASQVFVALIITVLSLSIPRRPVVFLHEQKVDDESAASIFSRYSFKWVGYLLRLAKSTRQITLDDISSVKHSVRAGTLQQLFWTRSLKTSPLWLHLYRLHRYRLWGLWFLASIQSILAYTPHYALFHALSFLEEEKQHEQPVYKVWFLAFMISGSLFFQQLIAIRVAWMGQSLLEVPMRSQLIIAIYQKCLFMLPSKDSTTARKKEEAHEKAEASQDLNESESEHETANLLSNENASDAQKAETKISKAQKQDHPEQSVSNLVAIDTARVSDFASRSYACVTSIVSLFIAVISLIRLLSWESVLAGIVVFFLFSLVNGKASKSYARVQSTLMNHRDQRMNVVTEALDAIRQIKFMAAEQDWRNEIMRIRNEELKQQRWVFFWIICMRLCWVASPIALSVVTLGTYVWTNGADALSASVAFTALALFNALEFSLSVIPMVIAQSIETKVSCARIEEHLRRPEIRHNITRADKVKFSNATIAWPHAAPHRDYSSEGHSFSLSGVNLDFPKGKFTVIFGNSGVGKSLLLAAIVGEAKLVSGTIYAPTSLHKTTPMDSTFDWNLRSEIAYVAQIPWLENGSIRTNILYGNPFSSERYATVVDCCGLTQDFHRLANHDHTEVSSKGISLSGGQRWRIALARAIYSRADTLVMDDIFSAVDTRVGRDLLNKCLLGPLGQGRTIILATHQTSLCLPKAAHMIRISSSGQIEEGDSESGLGAVTNKASSLPSMGRPNGHVDPFSTHVNHASGFDATPTVAVEEFREQGAVPWSLFNRYINDSGGPLVWAGAILAVMAGETAILGRGWWMNLWTKSQESTSAYAKGTAQPQEELINSHSTSFYLSIYIAISVLAALMEAVKCAIVYAAGLQASRDLYDNFTRSILHASIWWLDKNPLGRILNRLTSDFMLIDTRIPGDVHVLLSNLFSLAAVAVAGMSVSWFMIFPELLLAPICIWYASCYLDGARELKRLELTSKSPVLGLCESSISGIATIRAFGRVNDNMKRMFQHLDNLSKVSWSLYSLSHWLMFRLTVVGAVFTFLVSITAAYRHTDAAVAGFALLFAFDLMRKMENAIQRYANLQINMSSMERVTEYIDMERETLTCGVQPPISWPTHGQIKIEGLNAGYGPDMPNALQNLSISIDGGQTIGVVGRTGAGKSSLALALFRFLDVRSGGIYIDDVDITTLQLKALRSRLCIIPQDPVLLRGTVRTNLDPQGRHADTQLREMLQQVGLWSYDDTDFRKTEKQGEQQTPFIDLDSAVTAAGANFSQGQRQLLCLARAMLNRNKIVILDEATSNIDQDTDRLIKRTLSEACRGCTLIVIAHRLSTVADFDKIVVLSDGRAVEFDEPRELLRYNSEFSRLVASSGERDEVEAIINGHASGS